MEKSGGFLGKGSGLISSVGTLVLLILMIMGCAGTPEPSCPPKPDWISSPDTEGYYVGVGSADTGSRAEDRSVAEARARADLASRISATIRSELEVATSESTAEGASQEVRENVTQSVEGNLKDIETVDTYHCPGEGTWVYVRLDKMRWAEIQEERRVELVQRLQKLLEPVLEKDTDTFLLELETLLQARSLVYESPVGPTAKGKLAGKEGNLTDILGSHINRNLSSLSVSVERDEYQISAGEEVAFSGKVSSELFDKLGNLLITVERKEGTRVATTRTEESGGFTVKLPEGFSVPGEQHFVVRPSFEELEEGDFLPKDSLPSEELVFSVGRVQVGLVVETTIEGRGTDFSRQVKSLFADRELPLEFVEGPGGSSGLPLLIRFVLRIEDFPVVIENAPKMSQARALVSFEQEGKTVYSYESDPIKDGGISVDQAHQRVADKLFRELAKNEELFRRLEEAIITR